MKKVIIFILVSMILFLMIGCTVPEYTVTFEVNADWETVESVTVDQGTTVQEPSLEGLDGFVFNGWYSDSTFNVPYDFSKAVSGELTLYGKWTDVRYRLIFDTDGELTINDVKVDGDDYTLPTPELEGHTFEGWYRDGDYTDLFLIQELTEDTTIYAKFVINTYDVTFVFSNGEETVGEVNYGSLLVEPSVVNIPGHRFVGWFIDSELTTEYTFDSPIYDELTLYAKYEERTNIKVGANIYNFADNFTYAKLGVELERYANELGMDIVMVDSESDQALLNMQVDAFIEDGVDILLINLVDVASGQLIVDKAKAADIPLIFFNKEPNSIAMQSYDKVWYVGTNLTQEGTAQGEMIVEQWNDNPSWDLNSDGIMQYVLLKGEPGHPYAESRTQYALSTIVDSGIQIEELALQASSTWSTIDAKNTMDAWLAATWGSDIEVVIANNDGMAYGAITAMNEASVTLPLFGIDGMDQSLYYISNGEMHGTVMNDAITQARAIIDITINVVNGDEVTLNTPWMIDDITSTKAIRIPYIKIDEDNNINYQ